MITYFLIDDGQGRAAKPMMVMDSTLKYPRCFYDGADLAASLRGAKSTFLARVLLLK